MEKLGDNYVDVNSRDIRERGRKGERETQLFE